MQRTIKKESTFSKHIVLIHVYFKLLFIRIFPKSLHVAFCSLYDFANIPINKKMERVGVSFGDKSALLV